MNKDYWLKNVDWHLQPIPEASERQKPTDEEIRKWTDKVQPSRGGFKDDYIFAAKAMRDGKIPISPTQEYKTAKPWIFIF